MTQTLSKYDRLGVSLTLTSGMSRPGVSLMKTHVFHQAWFILTQTAAMVQWVRALAPQGEGWVFESQPRQT